VIAVNFHRYPDLNDPASAYPPTFYPGVSDQAGAKVITIEVGENRTGLEVQVPLPRPVSVINGEVVWSDGSPATPASIIVMDRTYSDSGIRHGVDVDQQGKFTIKGYVGQKFTLEAHSNQPIERFEPVRITLQRPTETVKIVINKIR
jgi:hypothetical protein